MSLVYTPKSETVDVTVETAQNIFKEVFEDAVIFFEKGPNPPNEKVCKHVWVLGNKFVSKAPVEATTMLKLSPPAHVFNALAQLTKEGEIMLWRRNLVRHSLGIGIDSSTIFNNNDAHEIHWKVRVHDVFGKEREDREGRDITHFVMVTRGINFEVLSSQVAAYNKRMKKKENETPGMAGTGFAKEAMDMIRPKCSKEELEVRVPTREPRIREKEHDWRSKLVMQPDANCDKPKPQVHEILGIGPDELGDKYVPPPVEPEIEPMVGDDDGSSEDDDEEMGDEFY